MTYYDGKLTGLTPEELDNWMNTMGDTDAPLWVHYIDKKARSHQENDEFEEFKDIASNPKLSRVNKQNILKEKYGFKYHTYLHWYKKDVIIDEARFV